MSKWQMKLDHDPAMVSIDDEFLPPSEDHPLRDSLIRHVLEI